MLIVENYKTTALLKEKTAEVNSRGKESDKAPFAYPDQAQLCDLLVRHIKGTGIPISRWYIGVISDPAVRRFVQEDEFQESLWVCLDAGLQEYAVAIRDMLVDAFGAKASAGPASDESRRFVFACTVVMEDRSTHRC